MSITQYIVETIGKLQEPLGLAGWTIQPEHGTLDGAKASCVAMPEYKQATLSFDAEKLQTGDELDEIIVHEMMHMHTWPIHAVAESLAHLASELLPKYAQVPARDKFLEEARQAGEDTNTQVGFVVIRLLRRLWAAEKELLEAKAEVKALQKAAKLAKVAE
jgi:hypothetical protein